MSMLPSTQLVQWQDLKVFSEVDLVLKTAQQKGWKDCEVFGQGDMITEPLETLGWKLIPADLYEYSIPAEGISRILQIVEAGVHIQGVIIADDLRRKSPPAPAKPLVSLPSANSILSFIGKILLGIVAFAMIIFFGLTLVTGGIFLIPMVLLSVIFGQDPKLVVLVDDGNGGTTWISVLTWYD